MINKEPVATEAKDIPNAASAPQPWSPKARLELIREYFCQSPRQLAEIVFCILLAILGRIALGILRMSVNQVSIPYQITANGDVILDLTLNREYIVKESISRTLIMVLTFGVPVVILFFVGFFFGPKRDAHASLCALMLAYGLVYFSVNFLKHYTGRLRPNFYDYCGFDLDTLQCTSENMDPRLSFPSGGAAISFCSMTLISLFFLGKVGLRRNFKTVDGGTVENAFVASNAHVASLEPSLKRKGLALLSITPIFLAFFIAATRVKDYYHHPSDVIVGSLIGFLCAMFTHSLWYPSINSPSAGIPLDTLYLLQSRAHQVHSSEYSSTSDEQLES